MRILTLIFGLLFIAVGCTLNSDQEMALNQSLTKFINARNSGDALTYAGLTHATIVAHYSKGGKESIKARFKTMPSIYVNEYLEETAAEEIENPTWGTPFQQSIVEKGAVFHIQYHISLNQNNTKLDSIAVVYAISEDSGQSWLYAEEQDYYAPYFPKESRLFKKQ